MLVGLLRGVNVGGNNRVPMAPLRSALTAAGLDGVATYLQSGNVLADHDDPERFGWVVREVIAESFGLDITVIVRSGAELADVLAWDPFPQAAQEHPKLVHVSFLADPPDSERLARLHDLDAGSDEWVIRDRELVINYDGSSHDSSFGRGLAKLLGTGVTARNWSTVRALVEMAGEG